MNMLGIKRSAAVLLALGLVVAVQGCGGGGDKAGACILCDDSTDTTGSAAGGLPSQMNFSLAPTSLNIEGYNVDGTPNEYSVIASDRRGNPVPTGTLVYFASEGGQIETTKKIEFVDGKSRAFFSFLSSEPRPLDGRITITAYALGEESFLDQNGNNKYDTGEPFQDLGYVFLDSQFNGKFDPPDEFILPPSGGSELMCANTSEFPSPTLGLDTPSRPNTCDSVWTGGGKVHVRRAVETVLSTSAAKPLWLQLAPGSQFAPVNVGLADSSCGQSVSLQVPSGGDPRLTVPRRFVPLADGQIWFTGGQPSGALSFYVADANTLRRNPMARGTTVEVSTPTTGLTVAVTSGTPVPNVSEASIATLSYEFQDPALVSAGSIVLKITSPSGLATSVTFQISNGNANRTVSCP